MKDNVARGAALVATGLVLANANASPDTAFDWVGFLYGTLMVGCGCGLMIRGAYWDSRPND